MVMQQIMQHQLLFISGDDAIKNPTNTEEYDANNDDNNNNNNVIFITTLSDPTISKE